MAHGDLIVNFQRTIEYSVVFENVKDLADFKKQIAEVLPDKIERSEGDGVEYVRYYIHVQYPGGDECEDDNEPEYESIQDDPDFDDYMDAIQELGFKVGPVENGFDSSKLEHYEDFGPLDMDTYL